MGKRKARKKYTADRADRHQLYQKSVQAPDFEVEQASKLFRRHAGRKALSLREDFCGTALLCAEWIKSGKKRTATGVDLDKSVLAWGRDHNLEPLGDDAERITLLHDDVRTHMDQRHDVVMALNYSYFCFKDRNALRSYFEAVRHHLNPDGIFIADLFGGWETQQVFEEERKYKHFHYIWDQAKYNPITGDFVAHIHFRFRDGTALERAFTYEWRLWTIPELREVLSEAGFSDIRVLWEDEDDEGEGTGTFRPKVNVLSDPCFNAYLVAAANPTSKKRKKS